MSETIVGKNEKTEITKGHLRWAALFLGELRDGLTMVCIVVVIAAFNEPIPFLPFSPFFLSNERIKMMHNIT